MSTHHSVTLAAILAASSAMLPPHADALTLQGCGPGSPATSRCTVVSVPEDRSKRDGRVLHLDLVVVRATAPSSPEQPPVFIVLGGPGQDVVAMARAAGDQIMPEIRKQHDLVFVQARGTGGDSALPCDLYPSLDTVTQSLATQLPTIRTCREQLARHADLARYTRVDVADDIDDARAALGYDRAFVYGFSYGTRVAAEFARRHPQTAAGIILESPVAPSIAFPLVASRATDDVIHGIFTRCAANAACAAHYPHPEQDLSRAMNDIRSQGRSIATAEGIVKITRPEIFVDILRGMLYGQDGLGYLPAVLHTFAAHDDTLFVKAALPQALMIRKAVVWGAYLSATCSEDMDNATPAQIAAAGRGTLRGSLNNEGVKAACDAWNVATTPLFPDDFRSQVPALLIGGTLDVASPIPQARPLTTMFARNTFVTVENGAHSSPDNPCVTGAEVAFLSDPGKETADRRAIGCSVPVTFP